MQTLDDLTKQKQAASHNKSTAFVVCMLLLLLTGSP